MGAVCDNVDQKDFGKLEQIVTTTNKSQYEEANISDVRFLRDKIEEISKDNLCKV